MFRSRTFQILRRQNVQGSTIRREMRDTGETISMLLEQTDAEFAALTGGEYTRSFRGYSDEFNKDVRIGDHLIGGGETYQVKGVRKPKPGWLKKIELNLEKEINQQGAES